MTRDEAHKIVFDKLTHFEGKESAALIDVFVALGMLKLDEPKTTIQGIVEVALNYSFGSYPNKELGAQQFLKSLDNAGLKVVPK